MPRAGSTTRNPVLSLSCCRTPPQPQALRCGGAAHSARPSGGARRAL